MYAAGTDFGTMEAFQASFDAKYLVFEVTGNMDGNPRVPELMVFQGTELVVTPTVAPTTANATPTVAANDDQIPATGDGFMFITILMLALGSLTTIFIAKKRNTIK